MDPAIAVDIELDNAVDPAADMVVDASNDPTKLPRALLTGGVAEAAAALYLALFRTPVGLFVRTNSLFYSYYGVLLVVALFGLVEAWTGLWVSHDPLRRHTVGTTVLWVSVLPLLFLAGIGGHTILG